MKDVNRPESRGSASVLLEPGLDLGLREPNVHTWPKAVRRDLLRTLVLRRDVARAGDLAAPAVAQLEPPLLELDRDIDRLLVDAADVVLADHRLDPGLPYGDAIDIGERRARADERRHPLGHQRRRRRLSVA